MKDATIAVSGVHSDPDPSPGIGVARSLREAFPEAALYAVDYDVRSSGLHHPVFDSLLVQPVWSELDLETYSLQILQHLDQPAGCWISGLDVESEWLAEVAREHPRLLVPSTAAQASVRKPVLSCAPSLGMTVPEFLPASSAPTDLHALGRRSGWNLWVKGKYHEAYRANGFADLWRQIGALALHWPREDLFVQKHVTGLERSIVFAAYKGRLLGAVEVEKRSVTSQGKTWAASVTAAPTDIAERLAHLVAEFRWTGGGEVEFVRDSGGRDWLIDLNPRFPAYIYGVTLCGHNLPACLVGAALGLEHSPGHGSAKQFIRVVQELPVREDHPLPKMVQSDAAFPSAGKHPSFQPQLVRRLRKRERDAIVLPKPSPVALPGFLKRWQSPVHTPLRFRDFEAADTILNELEKSLAQCSIRPAVTPALSVKTDPHPALARSFLQRGWWAEVISLRELEWALRLGFNASSIVFNGPRAAELTAYRGQPVAVAFADSVEALESLMATDRCDAVGLRVRPNAATSRFGIDFSDYRIFDRVANGLARFRDGRPLGIHMHFASDVLGFAQWQDLVEHTLAWGGALAQASGADYSIFDLGGGWYSDDFLEQLLPNLPALQARIELTLPGVEKILLEPGKAVASETAWLATRVLEVRTRHADCDSEVVVDASIADLPMAADYAHRVLHLRDDTVLGWLTGGQQRILGSICMETDVLANGVAFPKPVAAGDVLLFSAAGGYNASMAWHFASGVGRDT